MIPEERIRVGKLPKQLLREMRSAVSNYLVGLIHNDDLIGSGTLVCSGDKYGILTAHHVVYNQSHPFDFISGHGDMLGIIIENVPHAFTIPMEYLIPHHTGLRNCDEYGPDLCFLHITEMNKLGTLKAIKSFWPLDIDRENNIRVALQDENLCAVSCYPHVTKQEEVPTTCFENLFGIEELVGFTGVEVKYERDDFDYYEVAVLYNDFDSTIPSTFGGASGGGLWCIRLQKDTDTGSITFKTPILAGVIFYQTAIKDNKRFLRCHGPKSLYIKLLEIIDTTDMI